MRPGAALWTRRGIWFTLSILLFALFVFLFLNDDNNPAFSWPMLTKGLVWPLTRIMLLIGVGLVIGSIIEGFCWVTKIGSLSRPLLGFGRLGDYSGAAFTTAFFSGVAANAMLANYYKEKKISKKELFLSNFVNGLPAFFLHLPTLLFIVLPLIGVAGIYYLFLTFLAAVFRTFCYLLYGRFFLGISPRTVSVTPPGRKSWPDVYRDVKQKLPGRFIKIAVYVIPVFVCVFVVNQLGFFEWLRQATAGLITTRFIPMEAVTVVIISLAAEFTSGFAAAGALLQAGALTVKETVLALLIGNIIAFPARALRHQLPRYVGIFSPKLGTQMLLMGQSFRVLSVFLVALLYFFVG